MANWDHKSNIGTHPQLETGEAHNGLAQFGGSERVTLADVPDTHIPTGSLVTVSIGRNARRVPLSWLAYVPRGADAAPLNDRTWSEFQRVIRELFSLTPDSQVFGPFIGEGEWDGVSEESATFTVITGRPLVADIVGDILTGWAAHYGQEAIAWSYGPALLARA